jgi:hypothetical protein
MTGEKHEKVARKQKKKKIKLENIARLSCFKKNSWRSSFLQNIASMFTLKLQSEENYKSGAFSQAFFLFVVEEL